MVAPWITDAELITLAVMQALLGHVSEVRWLRYSRAHLHHLFRYLPQQPGYNKRLRRLSATIVWLIGVLARATTLCAATTWRWPIRLRWSAPDPAKLYSARTWPDGPSMATAPATPVTSGDCGCTCLPTCTGYRSGSRSPAEADERRTLLGIFDTEPALLTGHPGQTLLADKNYFGREFEAELAGTG